MAGVPNFGTPRKEKENDHIYDIKFKRWGGEDNINCQPCIQHGYIGTVISEGVVTPLEELEEGELEEIIKIYTDVAGE